MPVQTIHRVSRWGAAHPFWFFTAPLVGWVLLIAWGSLARPEKLPQLRFYQADKVEHFVFYGVLAVLLLRGWVRQRAVTFAACLTVEIVASGWGFYMEILQRMTSYRSFDLWDAASDALGALLGLAVWVGVAAWLGRGAPKFLPRHNI